MNNEVDDFLKQANSEGSENEESFIEKEEEFFKDVKPEEKEETVEEEKPLPFHKDPKVQRYIQKEIEKFSKDAQPQTAPTEVEKFNADTEANDDILVKLVGNDTPEKIQAVKDFKKYLGTLEERGARRAIAEIEKIQSQEKESEQQAINELQEGFSSIEERFGIDLDANTPQMNKMRDDYIDYLTRIAPKRNGEIIAYPDFEASFEEFQSKTKRSPSNSRAKELASRSMGRSENTQVSQKKGVTWDDVDRMLER